MGEQSSPSPPCAKVIRKSSSRGTKRSVLTSGAEFSARFPTDYAADVAAKFGVSSTRDIVWAHAVNSVTKLNLALQNSSVHMIEVDVLLGCYDSSANTASAASNAVASCAGTRSKKAAKLVCCHPPFNVSNLSLEHLLMRVCRHNEQCRSSISRISQGDDAHSEHCGEPLLITPKGIKLDFKDHRAVDKAISLCLSLDVTQRVPTLWLNADVLIGPGVMEAASVIPADAFIDSCARLPHAVASLGWKCTEYSVRYASYSPAMIDAMIDELRKVQLHNRHVTFAVSASYTLASLPQFERLLLECKSQRLSASLTVWTGTGSMGIAPETKEMILERTRILDIDVFIDVSMRKVGRSCNDTCTII